jgi:transcriptional regulator with XRE-family HTH domain
LYPNLKLQIWKSGLRQNRLAQMLNVDETMLSKIVNGFREPSDELKGRIADLLRSDVSWLFEPTANHNGDPPAAKAKPAGM